MWLTASLSIQDPRLDTSLPPPARCIMVVFWRVFILSNLIYFYSRMSWSAKPDLFELSTVASLAALTAYQWLQFVWVRFKNSILLVGNLSLHSNTLWSHPRCRDACLLESVEECFKLQSLVMQWAWTPLSGACSVCMSGQEGETDPLSSLELAHSQESVTWVSQPESTSRDCLALYLRLMVAFPSSTQPAVGGLLT